MLAVLNGSALVIPFLLVANIKNSITKKPPVQCAKSGAGLLFVQMHETEAATPSRHYVGRQLYGSYGAILREQATQTFHGRARGQISHQHLRH